MIMTKMGMIKAKLKQKIQLPKFINIQKGKKNQLECLKISLKSLTIAERFL